MLEKFSHGIQILSGVVLIVGVVLVLLQMEQTERLTRAQLSSEFFDAQIAQAASAAGQEPMTSFAKLCDPGAQISLKDSLVLHNLFLQRFYIGLKGYAVFWKLLEQIYLNEGYLEYNLEELLFTFRLENNESNKELIASVINDFELFKIDDSGFFNVRAQEYLEYVLSKSKKATESANKRYQKEPIKKKELDDDFPFN